MKTTFKVLLMVAIAMGVGVAVVYAAGATEDWFKAEGSDSYDGSNAQLMQTEIHFTNGADHIRFGTGVDTIYMSSGDDKMSLGPDDDIIEFYAGCPNTVRENTLLLTGITDTEKCDLLAASEMLVMPSRNDTFGVAFLEAWACRKPVIGALAGGVPEVISDGEDGLLVPFGDVEALAGKMALLLDDRGRAAAMGGRGYRKVLGRFAINRRITVLEGAYEKLSAVRT